MNRYVKPSNEIVREAKEWTLNTRRPETPRHTPGSDRWRSYHDAGDHLRIDKSESRPVTKQSVRLDPIAAPSPSKPPRPKGSANDRFVRLVEQFETSSVNDRWNYCEKIAKCFDKLDGEITAEQREKLLAGCAEILDRENVPSSQRMGVCQIMFKMRLGPVNMSALGSTVYWLTKNDLELLSQNSSVISGVVKEYENRDRFILQSLYEMIKFDPTAKLVIANESLTRQIKRCLVRLTQDHHEDTKSEDTILKVCMVLETLRRLLDQTTFFKTVETEGRLPELWLQLCQEFPDKSSVILNCSRLLSLSTQSEIICSQFRQPTGALVMAQVMESFIQDQDILVRILFALGNCIASDSRCRQLNTRVPRSIKRILHHYCKKCDQLQTFGQTDCDVILKVIRLVANFSLDKIGAKAILEEPVILKILLRLLELSVKQTDKKSNGSTNQKTTHIDQPEEIMKSSLAALNNLIYFAKEEFKPYLTDCSNAFISCLMQSNMLIISECCRALGNLSHYPEVEAIFSNGADQILHQLLDSSDINLVVNVIGIFINFSLVKSDLKVFDQSEGSSGIFKLLITMREFNDWRVSTLTLQLIWNLLRNAKKINSRLKSEISSTIVFIQEEASPPIDYDEAQDQRLFGEISEKMLEVIG